MNRPTDPSRSTAPTAREIAALTARLREITAHGRTVDPAERAHFLAAKDALIAHIIATHTDRTRAAAFARADAQEAITDAVRTSAEHPGYVTVGPSARTWLRDPDTGRPAAPVSEHEHRAVRDLLQREELDTTAPAWVTGPDGHSNVHSVVYPAGRDADGQIDDSPVTEDTVHAERLDDRPWLAQGVSVDSAHFNVDDAHPVQGEADERAVLPDLPQWMREQAHRTEAEIAAGTYVPGPPDDPAVFTARLAALRAESASTEDASARREQLARWHADDTDSDMATEADHDAHEGAELGEQFLPADGTEPT